MPDPCLYPPIEPYEQDFLPTSCNHQLYYEQSGNELGAPVVYLHGGPGGCTQAKHRQYFNPEKCRIILWDQRGCGKSQPSPDLEGNNTQELVKDLELLREHLGVDKWILFGGSWGSTLALCYAISYPERVKGLVVSGVFLGDRAAADWLHGGAKKFFPEEFISYEKYWRKFGDKEPVSILYEKMLSASETEKKEAALEMIRWEGVLCGMEENMRKSEQERANSEDMMTIEEQEAARNAFEKFAYTHSLTESHYTVNDFFLEEGYILKHADKLRSIPVRIVQGRYDMVCPPEAAWRLHQKLLNSELEFVPHAGHSNSEMAQELMSAVDSLLVESSA